LLRILSNADQESITRACWQGLLFRTQGNQGKIARGCRQFRAAELTLRHMRLHCGRLLGRQCLQRMQCEIFPRNVRAEM
jgi:hypothetical protein